VEKINEKIYWQEFLLALGLLYVGTKTFKDYKHVEKIFTVINSSSSIPSKSESLKLEQIRSEVIKNIKESDIFNRFDKPFIIDSISNIEFKVIDKDIIDRPNGVAVGVYISLSKMKSKWKYKYLDKPKSDNFILILRSQMDSPDLSETVVHEIYHYFDNLSGNSDIEYSKNKTIVDEKSLNDIEYVYDKITSLMSRTGIKYLELPTDLKYKVKSLCQCLLSEKEYLGSNSEIFARWWAFKSILLRDGIIDNINKKMTGDEITKIVQNNRKYKNEHFLSMLVFLDLDKVQDIE